MRGQRAHGRIELATTHELLLESFLAPMTSLSKGLQNYYKTVIHLGKRCSSMSRQILSN